MKTKTKLLALLLLLAATPMFISCGAHADPYVFDGINWEGDNGGTLELINGSNKDMILFVGQTPAKSSMLGGVRSGATRKYDISTHVDDFATGGYTILRGISKEEWDNNPDPTKAKIEFNSMVTYGGKDGQGNTKVYRYNIDPNYMGDNAFRVVNRGQIGIELRKDSPDGEKVAYLGALQQNQMVYTESTDALTLFPVYVFYNRTTGEITQLKSTTILESVLASPRSLAPNSNIQTYYFPNDETLTWEYIKGTLHHNVAYVTVTNNVTNQSAYVTNAVSTRLVSQNGLNSIGSGEDLVFEVASTEEGTQKALSIIVYNNPIPVHFEGDDNPPLIENGYNYSVSLNYKAGEGGIGNPANYTAILVKNNKRDISDQLESL